MIITVVGSYQLAQTVPEKRGKGQKQKDRSTFDEACRAIGEALGKGGHRLIVAHRHASSGEPADSAEALALEGFLETEGRDNFEEVPYHAGDPQLKAHTEAVERSDAVILIGGKEGTYAAGLSALLRRKVIITVPAFGGSARDLCEIDEINRNVIDTLRNLDTAKAGWKKRLTETITSEIDSFPKILIIHGRGDNGGELLEKVRKVSTSDHDLNGLSLPVIMDLSGKGAVSVPDVFEEFASHVSAAIAIVTADDIGGFARRDARPVGALREDGHNSEGRGSAEPLPATELRLVPRARENVWVEVGWFWGRLGRQRIFLWLEDEVPLPSDLQGAAWSRGEFSQAWPQIRDFIRNLREGHPRNREVGSFRARRPK